MKKVIKNMLIVLCVIICIIAIVTIVINLYMYNTTKKQIISEDFQNLQDVDCILVLGAGVWGDKPSPMLEDRLLQGIELYKDGKSNKIIMSGDHSKKEYDEVNIMKDFAIEQGVDTQDIFMDHAGFSTYESIYRAKYIFKAKKIIIVTQKYHLYRALYIANSFGLEAYGVPSNPREYAGQFAREIREILAREKDFINCIIKPEPTFLGDTIPVSGNGDTTNDK